MTITEIIVVVLVSIFCIGGLILVKKNENNYINKYNNEGSKDSDNQEQDIK